MVRVVSQNFSHPRSRHSSGETDLDLAMRADTALSTLRAKRNDLADYESSSDSVWDSEFDTDFQDHHFFQRGSAEDEINGNQTSEKSDVFSKRKERRRERNKVSAQAYRQRRRQVNVSTQQELSLLEEKNKRLLSQVRNLEQKTEQAKQYLKGQRVSVPDFLFSHADGGATALKASKNTSKETLLASASYSDQSLSSPCPSRSPSANINIQHLDVNKPVENNPLCPITKDFPSNVNQLKENTTNINSFGASCAASSVSNDLLSPALMSANSQPSVKPKQNLFNANHYYKIPIHQAKALRTVHEIPPSLSHDEEEEHLTLSNHPQVHDSTRVQGHGTNANCDELRNHNSNKNLINMNERVNSNLLLKEEKIWNDSLHHINPQKTVAMNDNENSTHLKSPVQNSPQYLLHPNSVVQFIISSGDNKMLSQ